MKSVNLKIEWSDGAEEQVEFEIYENEDGYALLCPFCDGLLWENGCMNGHGAYAIRDEEIDEKINNVLFWDEEEASA